MNRRPAAWLEAAAAMALGCAIGFAVFSLFRLPWAMAVAGSILAGAAASMLALRILELLAAERHVLPDFDVEPIPEALPGAGELFLRLRDVLAEASAADQRGDELLLEDALERQAADSRVVQLFQGTPLPSAGELQARIERHLERAADPVAAADDSDELFEALASLKRSLG